MIIGQCNPEYLSRFREYDTRREAAQILLDNNVGMSQEQRNSIISDVEGWQMMADNLDKNVREWESLPYGCEIDHVTGMVSVED
jgi:hypothetical protein